MRSLAGTTGAAGSLVTTSERRRFVRYDVHSEVLIQAVGQQHRGQTDDLGAGGCRIGVPWPLEKGLEVQVTLGTGPDAPTGRATVAWTIQNEPYRVGLAFSDPLAEQAIVLIQGMLGSVRLLSDEG
jgi:hypothetical protein